MAPLGGLFDIVRDCFCSIVIHEEPFSICRSNTKHSHRRTCSCVEECRSILNNKMRAQVPADLARIVVFCFACLVFTFSNIVQREILSKE